MSSSACLTWGELDLDPTGEGSVYEITAMATEGEGLDLGNPVPIEVALRSLLQDGSIVFSQGHDNREVLIAVTVRGATGDALAQAESALVGQIGRAGLNLTWRSVSPFTTPGVFEVVTSSLDYTFVPDREHALSRLYVIRLVCLPWVRSEDPFTSAASPVRNEGGDPITPVTQSVSTCSSLTGWSNPISGNSLGLTEASTAVSTTTTWNAMALTRTGTIDLTTQRYLVIDYKATASTGISIVTLRVAGVVIPPAAVAPSQDFVGYTRAYYDIGTTIPAFTLGATVSHQRPGGNLRITQVSTTNVLVGAGTTHQTYRRLPVPGSVRTQGSLLVEHESQALGDVLVYTWADDDSGYLPPLSVYATGRLALAGTVSGASSNLDTPTVFAIPAPSLPAGDYLLIARLRSATTGTVPLTVTAQTLIGGTVLDLTAVTETIDVVFTVAGSLWQVTPLTALTLPTVRLAGAGAATVQLSIAAANPSTANVLLDEAWLFNTQIGSLTQVSCGGAGTPSPGGQSRRVWIEPETVAARGTILRGHSADGSDAYYAGAGPGGGIASVGTHELLPGSMSVLTVTTEALDAETTISGYARWHTHPVL